MPFKQLFADRIIQRYLQGYNARMRVIQPRWAAGIISSDSATRREGLVLHHEAHEACHEGSFNSMWLKPTDWNAELSAVSLALTLGQARVSLADVEFALFERDTAKIEELSTRFLHDVAVGYTDTPNQQFTWTKDLTLAQRTFKWHYAQLYNVVGVIRRIQEVSPRAERLSEYEGMSDFVERLGTVSGQMNATYENLTQWLDTHIDDQQ